MAFRRSLGRARRNRREGGPVALTPTTPITSAPSFLALPAIIGNLQAGQLLAGSDGTILNGVATYRRWLLNGSVVSVSPFYLAAAAGSLVYEVTASGPGGTTVATSSSAIIPGSAPAVVLTLTGPLSFAADAASGTVIGLIGNVPAGVSPMLSPNDGRVVIAGSAQAGWKIAVGLSASSPGTISVTIVAAGASSVTRTVEVKAPTATTPPAANLLVPIRATALGMNESYIYDGMDIYRDLAYCVLWQQAGGDQYIEPNQYPAASDQLPSNPLHKSAALIGMGADGIPHTIPAEGLVAEMNQLVSQSREGTFEIVWNPSSGNSTINVDGNALTKINDRKWTASVNSFAAQTGARPIKVTFYGTLPPEGIRPGENFTIRKPGDTSTLMFTDLAIAGWRESAESIRWMSPAGTNNLTRIDQTVTGRDLATSGGVRNIGGNMPVPHQVRACNEADRHFYFNLNDQAPDSDLIAIASYIAANLKPTLRVEVEVSNEQWASGGRQGFVQTGRYIYRGIQKGYYNAVGNATPLPNCLDGAKVRGYEALIAQFDVQGNGYLRRNGAQPSNGQTVTIGNKVYTFQTALTNVDGNVKIGANLDQTTLNLGRAINLSGTAGTDYAAAMTKHTQVLWDEGFGAQVFYILSRISGVLGNAAVSLSTTVTNWSWGCPTMVAGAAMSQFLKGASAKAGDYVFCDTDMNTYELWQMTSDAVMGDMLPEKATRIASAAALRLAGRRAHVDHTVQAVTALRTAFGASADARVVPALGAWYLDSPQFIVDLLKWKDAWKTIAPGYYMLAPYETGVRGAGVRSTTYGEHYPAGTLALGQPAWTAAEKNLYSTNLAAFKDAFFAFAPYAQDGWIDYLVGFKNDVEAKLVAQVTGYTPYSIAMGGYEGLQFDALEGWPDGAKQSAAWNSIKADPRYKALMRRGIDLYRQNIGGLMMAFTRTGLPRDNGGIEWGIQPYEGSGSPGYSAFVDFKAQNDGLPPKIKLTVAPPDGAVGLDYSCTPRTSGGRGAKVFNWTGLPAGLTFSAATGIVSGKPTQEGTVSGISVSVTDDSGTSTVSGLSMTITRDAPFSYMRFTTTHQVVDDGYPSLSEVRFKRADGSLIPVVSTSGDQRFESEGHAKMIDGTIATVWTGNLGGGVVFTFTGNEKPASIEMEDRHETRSRAPTIFTWEHSVDQASWVKVFDQTSPASYPNDVLTIAPTYPA